MRKIRRVLLTDYIGAILVAVLVTDALSTLIMTAVARIFFYVQFRHDPIANAHRSSTTYSLLDAISRAALYLLAAYLIVRWLYPANRGEPTSSAEAGVDR